MKKLKSLPLITHLRIVMALTLAGCAISLIGAQFGSGDFNIGMVLGLVLLFGGITWHIVFIRCPHCGHHLNPRTGLSNFCPDCGNKLF